MNSKTPQYPENCRGVVKSDIVLFDESLLKRFFVLSHRDLFHAGKWKFQILILISDLILIIGTFWYVTLFNKLSGLVLSSIPLIIMNKELISQFKGRSIYILGNCNNFISRLCRKLGWQNDLRKLHRQTNTGRVWESQMQFFSEMQLLQFLGSTVLTALSLLSSMSSKESRSCLEKCMPTHNDIHKIHDRGNRKQNRNERKPKERSKIINPVMYDYIEVK